jgi:hypothetical protein
MASPSDDRQAGAIVIQKCFRGYQGRKVARTARSQHESQRRAALLRRAAQVQQTLIVRFFSLHFSAASVVLWLVANPFTRLQASDRARSRLEGLDAATFLETWRVREAAAVKVQKFFRGWRIRQKSTIHELMKRRHQVSLVNRHTLN